MTLDPGSLVTILQQQAAMYVRTVSLGNKESPVLFYSQTCASARQD